MEVSAMQFPRLCQRHTLQQAEDHHGLLMSNHPAIRTITYTEYESSTKEGLPSSVHADRCNEIELIIG